MSRVVIITKPTDYELLLESYGTESAARFDLESRGTPFDPIILTHARFEQALRKVSAQIPIDDTKAYVARKDLPRFLFRESDIVVTVGPDGLFANVARFVSDQPIITVNPDPKTVEGVLALHAPESFGPLLESAKNGTAEYDRIPLARAETDDRRELYAVNDFLIGRGDQGTAIYSLLHGDVKERQLSSGVIISTGIGSTGWIRSVFTIVRAISGRNQLRIEDRLDRADTRLLFVVREPMPIGDAATFFGTIHEGERIEFVSHMPQGGVVICDGLLEEPMSFDAGTRVTITPAARFVNLLVSAGT